MEDKHANGMYFAKGDNNNINKKLMDVLGSLDKDKIEQVTKMVQNMSSDDLNNIAKMLGVNNKKN